MVDTEFLNVYDSKFYENLPKLKPSDVTAAVLYALSTSEHTQVNNFLKLGRHSGINAPVDLLIFSISGNFM